MAVPGAVSDSSTASITVNVFDGTRQPFTESKPILITLKDGNQKQVSRDFHKTASVRFEGLTVFQNFGDNYTVIASSAHYKDAGFFPVKVGVGMNVGVDLMLLPQSSQFNFSAATWPRIAAAHRKLSALFSAGAADEAVAAQRYSDMMDYRGGAVLASLLNIATAMDQINLPQGTALDYVRELIWDRTGDFAMAQDRFFAWAKPALIEQVREARRQGEFADAPTVLHPGGTSSYKQIQFGEANVQLTFHEDDTTEIDGKTYVLVEPDIDYYKDPAAHALLEVLVNSTGRLTDPRTVYALRWIAGRHARVPEFNPLYTIERA
jgi:hypothetical protein